MNRMPLPITTFIGRGFSSHDSRDSIFFLESFGSPMGREPQEEESVATYDSERFGSFGSSLGHPQKQCLGHLGHTPYKG